MSSNDLIILEKTLEQRRAAIAPELNPAQFFELFVTEQLLKDYDLSYDELKAGHIAGGGDGGIDSLYLFANGELVQEDTDLSGLKRNVSLELIIIQAKTQASFNEVALDKLTAISGVVFNLSADTKCLRMILHSGLFHVTTTPRQVKYLAAR